MSNADINITLDTKTFLEINIKMKIRSLSLLLAWSCSDRFISVKPKLQLISFKKSYVKVSLFKLLPNYKNTKENKKLFVKKKLRDQAPIGHVTVEVLHGVCYNLFLLF